MNEEGVTYRLSWEMVDQNSLYLFCNENPMYYKGTRQTVPNSEIPDEYWHSISKEDSDPWNQARKLKEWDDADKEFVRNVKVEKITRSDVVEEVEIV